MSPVNFPMLELEHEIQISEKLLKKEWYFSINYF